MSETAATRLACVGISVLLLAAALVGLQGAATSKAAATGATTARTQPGRRWDQTDRSLALLVAGRPLWRFCCDKKGGKPYFHPLALSDGTVLTDLRPKDHPWHRGLWFSWKFINGVNYWEEDRRTGLSPGRTELFDAKRTPADDFSAKLALKLRYHPGNQPVAALMEEREIRVSAPDAKGHYRIDWRSTFTAGRADVLLDRTPRLGEKGGKSWGGYAGLSLRLGAGTRTWRFLDSEGRKGGKEIHGQKARWADFSGPAGGVAVFDHAMNLRSPTPWYVSPGMPYFGPALLFEKPLRLKADQRFTLQYRILVHSGPGDPEALAAEWASFNRDKPRSN